MSTKTIATWNPNACGNGLDLDQGNTIVTTTANALNNSRKVLSTLPKINGLAYTESEFYSVPQVSLGTNVAIGIAQTDSSLAAAVGADALSWGFYPATGLVLSNGATLATFGIIPERTIINVMLSFFSGVQHFYLAVEGSFLGSFALPAGKSFCLAATLAGGNAAETSLYTNFGVTAFAYKQLAANS